MTGELEKSLMIGKALDIYSKMSDGDKSVVAFGMTPLWAAEELEAFMENFEYEPKYLALSFMEVAKMPGNKGMVV